MSVCRASHASSAAQRMYHAIDLLHDTAGARARRIRGPRSWQKNHCGTTWQPACSPGVHSCIYSCALPFSKFRRIGRMTLELNITKHKVLTCRTAPTPPQKMPRGPDPHSMGGTHAAVRSLRGRQSSEPDSSGLASSSSDDASSSAFSTARLNRPDSRRLGRSAGRSR